MVHSQVSCSGFKLKVGRGGDLFTALKLILKRGSERTVFFMSHKHIITACSSGRLVAVPLGKYAALSLYRSQWHPWPLVSWVAVWKCHFLVTVTCLVRWIIPITSRQWTLHKTDWQRWRYLKNADSMKATGAKYWKGAHDNTIIHRNIVKQRVMHSAGDGGLHDTIYDLK